MTSPEDKIEKLVERIDQGMDRSLNSNFAPEELDELTDEELIELNRRVACLELLEEVRQGCADDENNAWSTNPIGGKSTVPVDGDKSATADSPRSNLPESIGPYQVLSRLGRGGYGSVYHCHDQQTGRDVAVKVPHEFLLSDQEARIRTAREAKAAAMLSHPNIIPLFHSQIADDNSYLVYGLAKGPTLASWFKDRPHPMGETEAAQLAKTLAEAIQHAHSKHVIHRDLKPANILFRNPVDDLSPSELAKEVCIADFGMARLSSIDPTITRSGDILGTPAYMSPEQASGYSIESDERSDIFSLGTILFELLTGEPPFRRDNPISTLRAVEQDPVMWPKSSNVHQDLKAIVIRCLAKAPSARYPTGQSLVDDLNRFLNHQSVSVRVPTSTERLAHWYKRNPVIGRLSIALASALVVGLIGIGYFSITALNQTEIARQNETNWRNAAQQAANNELRANQRKTEVEQLFHQSQLVGYGMSLTNAYQMMEDGYPLHGMEVIQASPLAFRGIEHDLVYTRSITSPLRIPIKPSRTVAFAGNGKQIFVGYPDRLVAVNLVEQTQQEIISFDHGCRSLAGSFDGGQIAVVSTEGDLYVYTSEGSLAWRFQPENDFVVDQVQFIGKTKRLLFSETSPSRSRVHSVDVESGSVTAVYQPESRIVSWKINAAGDQLVIGFPRSLSLMDFPSLDEIRMIQVVYPLSFQFDHDGSIWFSHSERQVARLDQLGNVKNNFVAHSNTASVRCMNTISGRVLSFSDKGFVRLWDPKTGVSCLELKFKGTLVEVKYLSESKQLAVVCEDMVHLINCDRKLSHASLDSQNRIAGVFPSQTHDRIWMLEHSLFPDVGLNLVEINWKTGRRFTPTIPVQGTNEMVAMDPDNREFWYAQGNQVYCHHGADYEDVSILTCGDLLEGDQANIHRARRVGDRLWITTDREFGFYVLDENDQIENFVAIDISFIAREHRWCTDFDVREDLNQVAAGFFGGQVVVFDLSSLEPVYSNRFLADQEKAVVNEIRFSPDGNRLLVNFSNHHAMLLENQEGFRPVHQFGQSGSSIAAMSPDGTLVAVPAPNPGRVEIYQTNTGTLKGFIETGSVASLEFSQDGKWLFTANRAAVNAVRVWDLSALQRPVAN